MEHWITAALYIAIAIAVPAVMLWLYFRQQRAREQTRIEFLGDSFARLKADPARLNALRGEVAAVQVRARRRRRRGRVPAFTVLAHHNFQEHLDEIIVYESRLTTVEGETVALQAGEDDVMIEDNARWLAERLGVRLEYDDGLARTFPRLRRRPRRLAQGRRRR